MKDLLNNTKVERLKPKEARYEIRDTGERGLILRVGKKGQKVWEVMVHRGSKRQRIRLGTFPSLLVLDARVAAQSAKQNNNRPTSIEEIKTVADLFVIYKEARMPKMRAWRDVQSVWDNWAGDRIGHIRLTDLSIHHGRDLRNHVARKSSEIRGSAIIRNIRPMFAWAADEGIISESPWANLKAGAIAPARDRVLSPIEWHKVWDATFTEQYPMGPFVRALMLSGQRKNNVASMRWDELHGDVWTIPKEKMKATKVEKAKSHEVMLSKALANLIAEQPRLGPFVFSTMADRPISPGSRLKDRIGIAAGFTDWRFHDVRRTAATTMTIGKVPRFIVERVLGHADNSVTSVYDRASYRDEKREAMEILASSVIENLQIKAVSIASMRKIKSVGKALGE
ncbi:MAG: integrase family protein [Paracoccaceae bacterium]